MFLSVCLSICPLAGQMMSVCRCCSLSFTQSCLACADKQERCCKWMEETHKRGFLKKDKKTELDNFYLLRVSGEKGRVRQGVNGSFVIKRLVYFLGASTLQEPHWACLRCLTRALIACPTSQQPDLDHIREPGQLRTKTSKRRMERRFLGHLKRKLWRNIQLEIHLIPT